MMNRVLLLLVYLCSNSIVCVSYAQDSGLPVVASTNDKSVPNVPVYRRAFAFGLAYVHDQKHEGTDESYSEHSGEVFGYYYHDLNSEWTLRPGLRFGYTPDQTPSDRASTAISISENDFEMGAELGVIWKRFSVFPAFTLGVGLLLEKTSLSTQSPVVNTSQSSIAGTTTYPFLQGQVSLLIPMMQGRFELAPFFRYMNIFGDSRVRWLLGGEVSVAVF